MWIFIRKIGLFLLPFISLSVLYVFTDPFKVIKDYDVYLSDYVMIHRGFISSKVYLSNREKNNFNSFIFGSSRSCAHTGKDWEKYLPENSRAYSYGSWNESINGIYRKIKLIDDLRDTLKNAFIVIDDKTFLDVSADFLLKDHYLISEKSRLDFHIYYFTQYFDLKMIFTSIDYYLFKKQRDYMNHFQGMKPEDLNPINNDWYRDVLPEDTLAYYKNAMHRFYERPDSQQYYPQKIEPFEMDILRKIKALFDKHGTDYKLIIAPLYDQQKIHPEDLRILSEIFGKNSVYDYSGINDITNNMYNYNEDVFHYRYKVGKRIYKDIYSDTITKCKNNFLLAF